MPKKEFIFLSFQNKNMLRTLMLLAALVCLCASTTTTMTEDIEDPPNSAISELSLSDARGPLCWTCRQALAGPVEKLIHWLDLPALDAELKLFCRVSQMAPGKGDQIKENIVHVAEFHNIFNSSIIIFSIDSMGTGIWERGFPGIA